MSKGRIASPLSLGTIFLRFSLVFLWGFLMIWSINNRFPNQAREKVSSYQEEGTLQGADSTRWKNSLSQGEQL